jgi:CRISPR-associated endonuclease Cas1 subtype I-B
MNGGDTVVVEIDIHNFFDEISLERLQQLLSGIITDNKILQLIKNYLYCRIEYDGQIVLKKKGLVQGNAISTVLSNLYLNQLDYVMERKGYHWIRFSDNIYVFTDDKQKGISVYNWLSATLTNDYGLPVNTNKSGVYDAITRRILGYEFYVKGKNIEVRKYKYQPMSSYKNWHESALQKVNQDYHLLNNGILNKKDYSLLFENEEKKCYLPVEVTDQINIYGDVTIATSALHYLSSKNIKVSIMDKYGNLEGCYLPDGYTGNAVTMLEQCRLQQNEEEHLALARSMETAGLHNIRANMRYYNKKHADSALEEAVRYVTECMKQIEQSSEVAKLLLIEARARQKYYHTFNAILQDNDFEFSERSRRPPMDPLNAMISFGNTLLYNKFLQFIWQTSLDPRIGVIHATNSRAHTLNLDFADIFKPIIVDRIIFSLVNLKQIRADEHFKKSENGGIYLSGDGKKMFIEKFEQKLADTLVVNGEKLTYQQLIRNEVYSYQRYVLKGEKYKPYKYY